MDSSCHYCASVVEGRHIVSAAVERGGDIDESFDPVKVGTPVATGTNSRPLPSYGEVCYSRGRSRSLASRSSRTNFEGFSSGSAHYSFALCTSRGFSLLCGCGRSFPGPMAGAGPKRLGEGEMSTGNNNRNRTLPRTYQPPCIVED